MYQPPEFDDGEATMLSRAVEADLPHLLRPQAEVIRGVSIEYDMQQKICRMLQPFSGEGMGVSELRMACRVKLTANGQEEFNCALHELTKDGIVFVDSGKYKLSIND